MENRTLATSKISVSRITFGCWELGGGQWEKQSDDTNIAALHAAFEMGIRTFDTAEGYGNGHSEEVVGLALEGKRRESVIATKVSPNHLSKEEVRRSVEASLKRLRTDYIDIYYIHWPNKDIPLEETMNEFRKLRDEKIIRAVAVSNFSLGQLQQAMSVTSVDAIQPEYSLLQRDIEKEIIPYCIEHGIGVMTYSSVAKGILTGAYHLNNRRMLTDDDFRRSRRLFLPDHLEKETELVVLVNEIAKAHAVSPAEIAIAWLLHQEGVTSAIVGTQNIQHLRDNARAVDVVLTDEQRAKLDEVSFRVLAGIDGVS